MRKLKTTEATGEILFHDLTAILASGQKGVRFRRGHKIEAEDIPVLLAMGKDHVFVNSDDKTLIHEEDAIARVLEVAIDENLYLQPPAEGKIEVKAKVAGVFCVNEQALHEINNIAEYTLVTLPDKFAVSTEQTVVGGRIVPLVAKDEVVDKAVRLASQSYPLFRLLPYQCLKVGIVITGNEIFHGRIQDAFEPILRHKLQKYPAEICGVTVCPDDVEVIERAVKGYLEAGANIVLMTGGMSVDPDDVTPTVIRKMSDRFLFQGVPIQPGNMLTVGYLGDSVLVGVPGASMHSPFTSLDILLPWIFAKMSFDAKTWQKLGLGGLSICQMWHIFNSKE